MPEYQVRIRTDPGTSGRGSHGTSATCRGAVNDTISATVLLLTAWTVGASGHSALLGPGGEAAGQPSLAEEEQQDDGQRQDARPSHQHRRGDLEAAGQLRETQRHRPVLAALDEEEEREQELVP